MIDITTALYNIMHSRYGKDVRSSIHDSIYQINENANEAVQTAKAMGVGTAISSPTSSSAGYVAGNLYLNDSTWDLWQCIGTDAWVNKGNVKGAKGDNGNDGTNYYVYIRFSQYYDGADFTVSPTASSQYIGIYSGSNATAPTNKADYIWAAYVGAAGTSSYVHIMYSEQADGSNFVSVPTANCKYIGFYSGSLSSPPANKSYYTWSEYVGKSGTGTGDMLKSEFAGKGVVGTVDKATELVDVTNSKTADTVLLANLSDDAGQLKYKGNNVGSEYITSVSNDFSVASKKLSLASGVTAKLPTLAPTSSDVGFAPVVQSDLSVKWGEVQGGISPSDMLGFDTTQGETVDDGIARVENNTAHNKVVDALVVKEYSNTYKKRIVVTTTTDGNTIGNWDDETTFSGWIPDTSLIVTDHDENVELQFMYEVDGGVPIYLGGYKWENTLGKLCVKFGTEVTSGTKIAIDIIHTRGL